MQAVPLVIGQFLEMVDNNTGIVGSTTGSNYYVRILSTLNRCELKREPSIKLQRGLRSWQPGWAQLAQGLLACGAGGGRQGSQAGWLVRPLRAVREH
jgi:hypothetical protein